MPERPEARVLLVEDNADFADLVELFLRKSEEADFQLVWKKDGNSALAELEANPEYDVVLMDHFLPGRNGLEVTRMLKERGFAVPVVFLTVNRDFDLAVEVMKLGVEDYLVKEEIQTPVLPRAILGVIERRKLREELTALEITQKRLEAIQELVVQITQEIRTPLDGMRESVESLLGRHEDDNLRAYLVIIRDNLLRIEKKLRKLKEMKSDKTITYIRDIKMFDLSEGDQ